MCISADHKHIALLNNDNNIWIGSSDLRKVYRVYNKTFTSSIDQMAWYLLINIITLSF